MNIQLAFSSGFLRVQQDVNFLLKKMAIIKRGIVIRKQIDQDQSLLRKFKFVNGEGIQNPIFSIKFWRNDEVIVPFLLLSSTFNIVLKSQTNFRLNICESSNTICISSLQGIESILSMSLFELQRRCKLQKLMRNVQAKYNNNNHRQKFRQIALAYHDKKIHTFLRILHRFMTYNSKIYLRVIKKIWNAWLIQQYQMSIAQSNQIIIREQFFRKLANKTLLQRCLKGWKSVTFEI